MLNNKESMTVDISSLTLIKILIIIIGLALFFYIRDVLLLVFVALILASAFDPWIDWMQKHKIPRSLGVIIIYLVVIFVLGGAVYLIIPPIIGEVNQLSKDFPVYWESLNKNFSQLQTFSQDHGLGDNIEAWLGSVQDNLTGATRSVFSTVFSFFGGLLSFFVILVITFYMTVEEQAMKRILRSVIPTKYQPYFTYLVNRMQQKIGRWLRGQLLISLAIFIVSWLGLSLLGVKFALVLALFAGVTELIPYLGPFIGAIPAVFIAFTQSPFLALLVVILYIIIQMLENHVLTPKIMQKAVGLNPVITIVVILIGAKLAGVLGIILAVPVTTALSILVGDLVEYKKEEES